MPFGILFAILWGGFVTHNVEQTNFYKCKVEKDKPACVELAKLEEKR